MRSRAKMRKKQITKEMKVKRMTSKRMKMNNNKRKMWNKNKLRKAIKRPVTMLCNNIINYINTNEIRYTR